MRCARSPLSFRSLSRAPRGHAQRSVTERGLRSSVVRRHATIGRMMHVCLWMWHDRLVLPHVSSGKELSVNDIMSCCRRAAQGCLNALESRVLAEWYSGAQASAEAS